MRTIPCNHQELNFRCPTCLEAIQDPGGKGKEWGVVPPEDTQASRSLKLRESVPCAFREGQWCHHFQKPLVGNECQGCHAYGRNLLPDLIDPISTGEHPDPRPAAIDGWGIDPATIQAHLEALLTVASQSHNLTPPQREGRGIVTVGGGKYWLGIVIGLRMLRSTGCQLPVEIWHGENEAVNAKDLEGLGPVTLHRIEKGAPDVRTLRGWSNKLYALTHTQLKEVLFLDADAYCVKDPAHLFALLNQATFVFWSDMDFHNTDIDWERVFPPGCKKDLPVIQGGQLVIDTQAAWPLLRLTHWICQHADYYFSRMYGDQDAYRVALSVLHWCQSSLHLGKAKWVHPCFVCETGGQDFIVHRCQSKFFPNKVPGEAQAMAWYAEGLASA